MICKFKLYNVKKQKVKKMFRIAHWSSLDSIPESIMGIGADNPSKNDKA
jgi:hypothetical protein